jgi:hypothetical protein
MCIIRQQFLQILQPCWISSSAIFSLSDTLKLADAIACRVPHLARETLPTGPTAIFILG